MFPIFILFFLLIIISSLTTIPLSIAVLSVITVLFEKSWVFFAAFLLGLFLDLFGLRPLAQTSLFFVLFVFIIWLYERKFETQTLTFVFFSSFLGSIAFLWLFGYQMVFLQSFTTALLSVLFFRFCHPELARLAAKRVSGSH